MRRNGSTIKHFGRIWKTKLNYCKRKKKYISIFCSLLPFRCAPKNIRIRHRHVLSRVEPSVFMQIFNNDFLVFDLPLMLSLCVTLFSLCVYVKCLFGIATVRPNNVSKYFVCFDVRCWLVASNMWRLELANNCFFFRISLHSFISFWRCAMNYVNVEKQNRKIEPLKWWCCEQKKYPVWSSEHSSQVQ